MWGARLGRCIMVGCTHLQVVAAFLHDELSSLKEQLDGAPTSSVSHKNFTPQQWQQVLAHLQLSEEDNRQLRFMTAWHAAAATCHFT